MNRATTTPRCTCLISWLWLYYRIGNSGPLNASIEEALKENSIVGASVLSGNRNFEARVHGAIKANFLMSPPLVVAYALACNIDLSNDQIGLGSDEQPVYLKDIWPTQSEIDSLIESDKNLKCSSNTMT